MKMILLLIVLVAIVPISILTMMWGWGLAPENLGWIAFGYLWMFISPMLIEVLK